MEQENTIALEQQTQVAPLTIQRRTALPRFFGDYRGIYPLEFGEAELFCQKAVEMSPKIGEGPGFAARVLAELCGETRITQATRVRATKLWHDGTIERRIKFLKAQHAAKLSCSTDAILAETAAIAFANPQDAKPALDSGDISKVSREVAGTLKVSVSVRGGRKKVKTVTIEPLSKEAALEKLMRFKGMFKDDNEQKKQEPPQINIYAPDSVVTINGSPTGQ